MRRTAIAAILLAACLVVALGSAAVARLDNIYIAAPYVWGVRTVSWTNYTAMVPNNSYNHNLYCAVEGGGLQNLQLDAANPVVTINTESYVALASEKLYDGNNLFWGNIVYGARADGGIDMCTRDNVLGWSTVRAEIGGVPIERKYVSMTTSGCTAGAPNPYHIFAVRQDGKGIDWLVFHPAVDEDPAYWTMMESIGNLDGTPHEVSYTKVVSHALARNLIYALRSDGFVDSIFRMDDLSLWDHSRMFRPGHESATYIDLMASPGLEGGSHTISFGARTDGGIDRFFWNPANGQTNGGDEVRPNTDPVYTKISGDAGTNHCVYAICANGLYRIPWDYAYWQQTGIVRWNANLMTDSVYNMLTYNARYGNEMFAQGAGTPPPTVTSIADAKTAVDSSPVAIQNALVSAVYLTDDQQNVYHGGGFGITTSDFAQGLRVVWNMALPEDQVMAGDLVDIEGIIGTSNYYERVIFANKVTFKAYGDAPAPFGMSNAASGGGTRGPQDAVVNDGRGLPLVNASGLNTIGSLVTIYGKVTYVHEDIDHPLQNSYFYVDDGSGVFDGAYTEGEEGVKTYRVGVKCRTFIDDQGYPYLPVEGQYVSVTGLMGSRKPSDVVYHPARYLYTTAPIVMQKAWL